mgnify:CR=1 FL=1
MNTVLVITPIFALILLGHVLRRVMAFRDDFWSQLDKLIYFVFFPALLFHSLSGFHIDFAAAAPMLEAGVAFMLVGMGLGYAAKYLFQAPPPVFASAFQCSFRFNSYVGLAVAGALHGQDGIAAIGLLMGFLVPMANIASVWALAKHGEGNWLREILFNPLILATVVGIAFSLAGWRLPEAPSTTIGLLSQASLPMGLIAVGAGLRLQGLNRHRGTLWYGVAVKLAVLPAAAWGLAMMFGLHGIYFHVIVLMAALPLSTLSYVLAARMGGDGNIAAAQVVLTTLLAMVTLPVWLLLMGF